MKWGGCCLSFFFFVFHFCFGQLREFWKTRGGSGGYVQKSGDWVVSLLRSDFFCYRSLPCVAQAASVGGPESGPVGDMGNVGSLLAAAAAKGDVFLSPKTVRGVL